MQARTVTIRSGGEIDGRSFGQGAAGNLTVTAKEELQIAGGRISTQAEQAGGGSITVQAGQIVNLLNGEITTTVQGGGEAMRVI